MRVDWTVQPKWAVLTVWAVVNSVNLLQAAGFLSRVPTGSMAVNHRIGYVIAALALPAAIALWGLVRTGAGWLHVVGPAAYVVFVAYMVFVEYVRPIEFRSPARPEVLVPYLVLFFGSIVLMGLPMFRVDQRLWLITASTSVLLLAAMGVAMRAGVG